MLVGQFYKSSQSEALKVEVKLPQAFTKHLLWTMMSNFLGSTGEVISTSK